MDINKNNLRKNFKTKRSNLSSKEVEIFSNQISENFIKNLLPEICQTNNSQIFSLYISANKEVDTNSIKKYFIDKNISFCYPKIVERNSPLDFILYQKDQELTFNKYFKSIEEPIDGAKTFPNIIILPLLAFDLNLSRLGMGGGFFDRTISSLKKQNSKIITIGLAYDFQRSYNLLPFENTDQKLDFIVTQKTIFSSN